jgi:excisionase family DNA binding protein
MLVLRPMLAVSKKGAKMESSENAGVVGSVGHSARVLTVEETAQHLLCGRNKVYELLASGHLKRAKRLGHKTLITRASLDKCVERHFGRAA